jgi:hypothetical protein
MGTLLFKDNQSTSGHVSIVFCNMVIVQHWKRRLVTTGNQKALGDTNNLPESTVFP